MSGKRAVDRDHTLTLLVVASIGVAFVDAGTGLRGMIKGVWPGRLAARRQVGA